MTTLNIDIKDDSKIDIIINILKDFDFIEIHKEENKVKIDDAIKSVFGIWKNREISIENIRHEAWGK